MERDPHQHGLLAALERIFDFITLFSVAAACFGIVRRIYPGEIRLTETALWLTVSGLCTLTLLLYHAYGVYQPMRVRGVGFFGRRIGWVNLGVSALVVVVLILFGVQSLRAPILWVALSAGVGALLLFFKKSAMMSVLYAIRARRRNVKHVLLLTDSREMAAVYREELETHPHFGYSLIGYVGDLSLEGISCIGRPSELDAILRSCRPDEVVIAFESLQKQTMMRYCSICNDHCIKVLVLPAVFGYFRSPKQIIEVGNLPMIDLRATPLDDWCNRAVKRGLDLLGAAALILLTAPVMLIAAVGVRLSSPGPILFRQTRVGKNMRPFTIYKFRSMRVNERERDGWSRAEDARRTRFGAWMRKLSIDELPQLFNVLKGEMSLVGPRPEVPFHVDRLKREIPLYMLKHSVAPGITGLAQIKGLRGDTSIQARIDEDLHYIENWSLWLDLSILLCTPFRAWNRQETRHGGEGKNGTTREKHT